MAWVISYVLIGIGVASLVWMTRDEDDDERNVPPAGAAWPIVLAVCVLVVVAEWMDKERPPE